MTADIIVVTYNRGDEIEGTISEILKHRESFGTLYCVVNGSTDDTTDRLAVFEEDPQVMIIHESTNLGVSAGRNIGLKMSMADVAVLIDDDAFFYTERPIERILSEFKEDRSLGIIQCKIVNFYDRQVQSHEFPGPSKYKDTDKPFYTGYFIGAGHAIRKSLLETCGYYPEGFFYAHEEVDLSYRVINAGFRIRYVPDVGVYHKNNPGGRLASRRVEEKRLENRLIMSFLYLPVLNRVVTDIAWTIRTLLVTGSMRSIRRAHVDYRKQRGNYRRQPLTRSAIRYLKKNHGRLFK